MKRLNFLIILLAVLLIAAYSNWLLTTFKPAVLSEDELVRHTPDYYLTGSQATVVNIDGSPRYQLSAENVLHYADDNSLELQQPRLRIFNETRPSDRPWEVDAERGIVLKKGEEINLLGKVEIRQPASATQAAGIMVTQDLSIFPQRSYARTDAHADIRLGNHHLAGTGMEVYFDQRRLEMLSRGKATYVVQ